jgi:transposase
VLKLQKRLNHLCLPGQPGGHGGVAKDNRLFINAVWYVTKTGIPWKDLPERFGKWDTVYHRFNQWSKKGVWRRVFEAVQDPDLEWLMVDSTVIRAHHHAAGMNGGEDNQALGRSRSGFGTKIHLALDSLGNPVSIELSPGQDADVTHAEKLLRDHLRFVTHDATGTGCRTSAGERMSLFEDVG